MKLLCATQGLWIQREFALNAFIFLSLLFSSLRLPSHLPLFHAPYTHTNILAHNVAHTPIRASPDSHNYGWTCFTQTGTHTHTHSLLSHWSGRTCLAPDKTENGTTLEQKCQRSSISVTNTHLMHMSEQCTHIRTRTFISDAQSSFIMLLAKLVTTCFCKVIIITMQSFLATYRCFLLFKHFSSFYLMWCFLFALTT